MYTKREASLITGYINSCKLECEKAISKLNRAVERMADPPQHVVSHVAYYKHAYGYLKRMLGLLRQKTEKENDHGRDESSGTEGYQPSDPSEAIE